mmetsp:Transcript_10991/g.16168  ORF Transcript_10991/g.16168 Transcript_10991/m.16168 type:complete len:320 (-) Transcript_10991:539-1498(-)
METVLARFSLAGPTICLPVVDDSFAGPQHVVTLENKSSNQLDSTPSPSRTSSSLKSLIGAGEGGVNGGVTGVGGVLSFFDSFFKPNTFRNSASDAVPFFFDDLCDAVLDVFLIFFFFSDARETASSNCVEISAKTSISAFGGVARFRPSWNICFNTFCFRRSSVSDDPSVHDSAATCPCLVDGSRGGKAAGGMSPSSRGVHIFGAGTFFLVVSFALSSLRSPNDSELFWILLAVGTTTGPDISNSKFRRLANSRCSFRRSSSLLLAISFSRAFSSSSCRTLDNRLTRRDSMGSLSSSHSSSGLLLTVLSSLLESSVRLL